MGHMGSNSNLWLGQCCPSSILWVSPLDCALPSICARLIVRTNPTRTPFYPSPTASARTGCLLTRVFPLSMMRRFEHSFELQTQRKWQQSSPELLPADIWACSRVLVSARRAVERRGGGKPKTPAIWLINIYSEVTNTLLDKTELAEGLRGSDRACF